MGEGLIRCNRASYQVETAFPLRTSGPGSDGAAHDEAAHPVYVSLSRSPPANISLAPSDNNVSGV